jgi:rhodanese-related sulfurtransferase
MTNYTISKQTLIGWLRDGAELAVLDIRPAADVGYASPLFATNVPADRLDAELDRFVPRRVVRTVLVDDGKGDAQAAVVRLAAAGWTDIHALEGGISAWVEGGVEHLPTFDIPGIPFVIKVRNEKGTPVVTASELQALRDRGEDVIVLDSRTVTEYSKEHVPGAISVPGAELLLRFKDLVPLPTTKVLVSCAGLPRAILGAQTLIDAGVPNPVAYLDDGTKGWTNAGLTLETGKTATYGNASNEARRFAENHVSTLARRDALRFIDRHTAERWARDTERTTYYLDVRTPEEFATGHLSGTISSEGGQLLGVAYRTIAVRGARVILVDDLLGVRARTVAHWLSRRGYEIAILLHDFADAGLESVA